MSDILLIRWRAEPPPIEIRWRGGGTECFVATINAGEPIAAVIGPRGARGPAGAASISIVAAVALSGHRAVIPTADGAAYPSLADPAHGGLILGITTGAAAQGMPADIQSAGELVEPSWSWAIGPVFAGDNGILTQSIPAGAWQRRIGTAIAPTRLLIEPRPEIRTI